MSDSDAWLPDPDADPPSSAGSDDAPADRERADPVPDGGGDGAAQENSIQTLTADMVAFRSAQTIIESQVIQQLPQERTVRRFSAAQAETVTASREEASARWFRGADAEADALAEHLERDRVLLLSAERGARKVATAMYLAWRLRQRGHCARPTLLVESVERHVQLDVARLARGDADLTDRLLIFRAPFAHAHPDVTRLFESTDRAGWRELGDLLRERRAFLVFTATPDEAAAFRHAPAGQALLRRLRPHDGEVLAQELDRALDELGRRDVEPAVREALVAGRDRLLGHFRFAPQLSEFVGFYADLGRPGLPLDEAFHRWGNTTAGLLQELDGDPDAWSFGFALALAQCQPEPAGVAWMDFDRLHRHVRGWLRRDLRLPTAAPEADPGDTADVRLDLTDASLLRRCRAEVAKDASTMSDVVRFREAGSAERLWEALLSGHRRVLSAVLPRLRELAERDATDLPTLRVLAAQVVGRCGEMDPERTVLPLIEEWIRASGQRRRELGPLLEGVVGSGNERYLELCIHRLRPYAGGAGDGSAPDDPETQKQLQAIISAYAWVGGHALQPAMRELGAITRAQLVPRLAAVQAQARRFRLRMRDHDVALSWMVLKAFEPVRPRVRKDAADVADDAEAREAQREQAERLSESLATLLSMQAALVFLCREAGPAPVFRELRRWIVEGGWETGVLLSLLFFRAEGIAERLDGGGTEGGANLVVEGLLAGDDAVRGTARLLGDLYESLHTPFAVDATLQRYARESLLSTVGRWSRAAATPEQAAAVGRLLHALARTHDGILREPLGPLLASRPAGEDFRAVQAPSPFVQP